MPKPGVTEYRYRLWYLKDSVTCLLGHLDTVRMVERTLRQAALPLVFTEGFSKKPKLTTCPPLPLGYTSRMELLDFHTHDPLDAPAVLESLRSSSAPRTMFHKLRQLDEEDLPLAKCLYSMLVELVFMNEERVEFIDRGMFDGFVGKLRDEQPSLLKGLLGWGITSGRLNMYAQVRGEVMGLSKFAKAIAEHFSAEFITGERVLFLREDGGLAF
jgi:hypothetical protein